MGVIIVYETNKNKFNGAPSENASQVQFQAMWGWLRGPQGQGIHRFRVSFMGTRFIGGCW